MIDAVTYLAVAACAALLALQLLGERSGRWLTSAQALTPWLVPLAVPAAVVAALRGEALAASAGAVVATAYLAMVSPLVWPATPASAGDGQRLRVLHANLLYRNRSIETAIEELAGVDADVIALSELTPEFAAVATSRLQTTHPHTCVHAAPKALGLGIWSRRPLAVPARCLPAS